MQEADWTYDVDAVMPTKPEAVAEGMRRRAERGWELVQVLSVGPPESVRIWLFWRRSREARYEARHRANHAQR